MLMLADDLSAVCDILIRNDCMIIISQCLDTVLDCSQGSQNDESETEAQQKDIRVLGRECRLLEPRDLHKLDIGWHRVNISGNLATFRETSLQGVSQ